MSAGKPPGRPPHGDDGAPDPDDDGSEPDDPFDDWFPDQPSQPERDRFVGRMFGGVWIERCIGEGGMGRVYKGLSRDRGHAVAVKVIQPGFASIEHLEALQREARILGLFDHPNIAPVYAAGTEVIDGMEVPFLVMKLIRGARSIVDYAVEERLSTKQRVKLFRKVCAAVGHGHGRSIIHRDLKPSNILVDESGTPFIIDFGVARSLNPDLSRLARRDRTGEIPGTCLYMSPEQLKGDPDAVDKRTDVYSLGVILYELLTGKLPHDVANKPVGEIARIVQYEPPVPIERRRPDLKPVARQIVRKCLEKRPADRYPDASALLGAFIGGRKTAPMWASLRARGRRLAQGAVQHRALLGGVVLGACLALVGERAIWLVCGRPARPMEPTNSMVEPTIDVPPAKTPTQSEAAGARAVRGAEASRDTPVEPVSAAATDVTDEGNRGANGAGAAQSPAVAVAPAPSDSGFIESEPPAEDEPVVDKALKWLVEHQLDDGSWSFTLGVCPKCAGKCSHSGTTADRAGATAMALLPFLGRGYTHREGPYKRQVERGIAFLASRSVAAKGKVYDQTGTVYSQGLAATALSECYDMTRDNRLAQPAQLALDFIMSSQDQRGGGWRHEPGQPGDMTSTACQLMALKSGNMAYLQVNRVTVAQAIDFLDRVQVEKDYGHRADEKQTSADPRSTAEALLCRMYLGWKKDNPALQAGVRYLAENGPTKDLTYDLYATEVMHHMEGDMWLRWDNRMKRMLLNAQSTKDHEAGSWYEGFEDSDEASAGGRLFCTATAALILEVYYRHLPIYRNRSVDEEFKE